MCVSIFFYCQLLGNYLGDGRRYTVRRYKKHNGIGVICRIVISDPLITQNGCHRAVVEQPDDADDDSGRRQNPRLHDKSVSLFVIRHCHYTPKFIRSASHTFPDISAPTHSMKNQRPWHGPRFYSTRAFSRNRPFPHNRSFQASHGHYNL